MKAVWSVLKKELVDALRDRRTLAVILVSSVAIGPLALVLLSSLVSSLETRAERRVVVAVGIEHAPTLANFIERQSVSIAPRRPTTSSSCAVAAGDPVLVVPKDFEARLARGEVPVLELVSDIGESARPQAGTASRDWSTASSRARHAARWRCAASPAVLQCRRRAGPRPGQPAEPRRAVHRHAAVLRDHGRAVRRAQRRAGHHGRRARARLARAADGHAGVAAGDGDRQVGRGGDAGAWGSRCSRARLPAGAVADAQRDAAPLFQFGLREAAPFLAAAGAAGRVAVGGDDGGGDPLPQLQGGPGQQHGGDPGRVAAAAGGAVQPGRRAAWRCGCRRWRSTR